jgi:uncharacterized membrane protein YeiB
MNKKNVLLITVLLLLISVVIVVVVYFGKNKKEEEEKKEPVKENQTTEVKKRDPNVTISNIKTALAEKLAIKPEEVLIPYYMELSNYMTGGINYNSEEHFFAATYNKEKNLWTVVHEGKDMIPCKILDENSFPKQMRQGCVE